MSIFTGWYIEKKLLKSEGFRQYLVKDIQGFKKKKRVRLLLNLDHDIQQSDVEKIEQFQLIDFVTRIIEVKANLARDNYTPLFVSSEYIYKTERANELIKAFLEQSPINEINLYKKNIEYQYIHGTTFIEGNTLNLQQVKDVLERGHIPSGKSLREINEIQNYVQVLNYRRKYRGKVTLSFIKNLHKLIVNNTFEDTPGEFRNNDFIAISGCEYQVCPSILIEESLENIINDYYEKLETNHYPFEMALYFHYCFEMIHPFNDGNGRVGRELLNYLLERKGYQQYLVIGPDRDRYLQALKFGNESQYSSMILSFSKLYVDFYAKIFNLDFENRKITVNVKTPDDL